MVFLKQIQPCAEPIFHNFSDSAAMKVREGQSQMVLTTKNGKIVDQSITQVHNSINNYLFLPSSREWKSIHSHSMAGLHHVNPKCRKVHLH